MDQERARSSQSQTTTTKQNETWRIGQKQDQEKYGNMHMEAVKADELKQIQSAFEWRILLLVYTIMIRKKKRNDQDEKKTIQIEGADAKRTMSIRMGTGSIM